MDISQLTREEILGIRADRAAGMGYTSLAEKWHKHLKLIHAAVQLPPAIKGGGQAILPHSFGDDGKSITLPADKPQLTTRAQTAVGIDIISRITTTDISPLLLAMYQGFVEAGFEGKIKDWLEQVVAEWRFLTSLTIWFRDQMDEMLELAEKGVEMPDEEAFKRLTLMIYATLEGEEIDATDIAGDSEAEQIPDFHPA